MKGTLSPKEVSTRLLRVAKLAREAPDMVWTTLAHHIDKELLREAYRRTRKSGAPGVDGQTAADYAKDLDRNLEDLLNRFKSGRYKAPLVKRVHIPKGDGSQKTRALGLPTFEDKVLQRAVTMVLEAIYEQEFFDGSYGFRPGRSQHRALESVREAIMSMRGGWILEIDIQDFFGSMVHQHLRGFLDRRVRDGVIRRTIDKWLKAGVMEGGRIEYPEDGTPQGGVVSPMVSNVYLHEVMDKWFDETVKPRLKGKAHEVRYADDIVLIFEKEEDAKRVLEVLPKRFNKYGLTLHPEKTRLLKFQRPQWNAKRGETTFDFLGLTHYWGKSRKDNWVVKKKTARKRFQRCLRAVKDWCKENRHETMRDQHQALKRKLTGHYNYYGVTGNSRCIANFHFHVRKIWFKWLNYRSEKKSLTWERYAQILNCYPLPLPRIRHSALRASPVT